MFDKKSRRERIRRRIRKNVTGTSSIPRLSLYRSNNFIYCQLIDDLSGKTLGFASSRMEGLAKEGTKVDHAKKVGLAIAEKAKSVGIEKIVFDRGGYKYHGRVKSLAEGAREGGLQF